MTKNEVNFSIIEDKEEFDANVLEQYADDAKLVEILDKLVQDGKHKELNFSLVGMGTMLQTLSIFLKLKTDEINDILKLEKDRIRQRRMNIIINEVNEKINLKYDFEEETAIVKKIFIYDNQSYMIIDKVKFIELLFGKNFFDMSNLEGL